MDKDKTGKTAISVLAKHEMLLAELLASEMKKNDELSASIQKLESERAVPGTRSKRKIGQEPGGEQEEKAKSGSSSSSGNGREEGESDDVPLKKKCKRITIPVDEEESDSNS